MIKLADNTQLETNNITGGNKLFQGQSRQTVELELASRVIAVDAAFALYKNANALDKITVYYSTEEQITDETTGETTTQTVQHANVLEHYTLPVLFSSEERDGATVYKLLLAQKSEMELSLEKLTRDNQDVQLALIELAEIAAGGEA